MFTAPGIDSISKDLRKDLASEIPGADPFIWPNNLYVALKVIAQALRALYLRLQQIHLMAFVSTATGDYLDLHAAQTVTSRAGATLASGYVLITGADETLIPAGTRLTRLDGVVLQTTADATISGVNVSAPAVAEQPGKAANSVPATPLELEAPIDGVTAVEVDDTGITGGKDAESDASLRERLLDLKRNPPAGGKPSEYLRWVRENKVGATRVFVQRATPDAGHVSVTFMMDDAYPDGIPLAADIDDVVAILDANAPADAAVHVYAPSPVTVDIQISSLSPDINSVQQAIRIELAAMFRRRSEPGSASAPFTLSRSWIEEAISNSSGEDSHHLDLPAADISIGVTTAGIPEIAVLGAVSFV